MDLGAMLAGKRVLVTGASSGLGENFARLAAGCKAKVVIGARRKARLDTAKLVIQDFIGRRRTDRIGVVVFGKSAFVLSPPTLDYHLLSQLVAKMTLNVIDGNATAIGDAVGTAVARLRRSDAQSKVIILLTDGDSNAGMIAPDYATHLAKEQGAKVYTIQIGTEDEVERKRRLDTALGTARVLRFTGCAGTSVSFSEVLLTPHGAGFGVYVQIKQVGDADRTDELLGHLRLTGGSDLPAA